MTGLVSGSSASTTDWIARHDDLTDPAWRGWRRAARKPAEFGRIVEGLRKAGGEQ
jgi:hypothetical protein